MKLAIVLGTRPEIIKLAPIVKELEQRKLEFFILHTGQHYSYNMDRIFFQQLQLPDPKYNLEAGSGTHAQQTAKMLTVIEQVLLKEKPDIVIVQGDTNTTLAGALAAAKLQIPVAHVEAGLRSFDMSMPEEINRVLVDHISTLLFAPTEISRRNLEREAVTEGVYLTGNTIVDAINRYLPLTDKATLPFNPPSEYALLTLHRQENVDNPQRLANAIKGVGLVAEKLGIPIIFPVHPRALEQAEQAGALVIKHPHNMGYGAAVLTLMHAALKANAEYAVLLDADGQHDPKDIPKFKQALQNGADIAVGNRFTQSHVPAYRKLGIAIIRQFLRLFGVKTNDPENGYRAFTRKALETLTRELQETWMGISSQTVYIASHKK